MMELIISALNATEHYHEAGGNLNILYVNGQAKNHTQRYIEIFDYRAKLVTEITQAHLYNQLTKKETIKLIDRVLFGKERIELIEKDFLNTVPNAQATEFALRGYKLDEVSEIVGASPKPRKSRTPKRKRNH